MKACHPEAQRGINCYFNAPPLQFRAQREILYFPFPYINARHSDEGGTLYFSSTNPEDSGRTACRKTRSICLF